MSAPQPGWYPDPTDERRWRWWNGTIWTDEIGENGRRRSEPLAPQRAKRRVPGWAWVLIGLVLLPILLALWPLLGAAAIVVVVTGVVALATKSRTWLRFPSRKVAAGVTAAAAVIVLATGGLSAAALTYAPAPPVVAEPAPLARPVDGARSTPTADSALPTSSVASPSPTKTSSASPSATPKPTPTRTAKPPPAPVVRTVEVSVTSAIPFARTSVDDAAIPRGQSRLAVAGVDGEAVSVFSVTTVDGVETERTLIRESVSREAVAEVTAVGTYEAPPPVAEPVPEPPASDGCHSSYADACVPIDSDVDCAGGSGNGPSYFEGIARVVGPDVYDLDRDGDGWACNG